jgi:hypothetical protein
MHGVPSAMSVEKRQEHAPRVPVTRREMRAMVAGLDFTPGGIAGFIKVIVARFDTALHQGEMKWLHYMAPTATIHWQQMISHSK